MTYPKPLMSVTEMQKLGFSRDFLYRIARHKLAHKYIRRTSAKKTSKILFDTEVLDKLMRSGEVR